MQRPTEGCQVGESKSDRRIRASAPHVQPQMFSCSWALLRCICCFGVCGSAQFPGGTSKRSNWQTAKFKEFNQACGSCYCKLPPVCFKFWSRQSSSKFGPSSDFFLYHWSYGSQFVLINISVCYLKPKIWLQRHDTGAQLLSFDSWFRFPRSVM